MQDRISLTEVEAYSLCKEYGVPCPDFRLVRGVSEVCPAAEALGFPVAVKIVSPDILHKTDVGCVEVGIESPEGAQEAFERVIANARRTASGVRIDGVLIQKMAPRGLEVIVGSQHDPTFGAALMFGLGGVFADVLNDVTFRLAPIEVIDAEEMLSEIKASRVLDGYRGGQPVNKEALVAVLLAVSKLVTECEEIDQVDLNPVIAGKDCATAVDARILLKKAN
jgi:acyl-CoA synthetase (NDP forming)